ncbi:MAG: hypothetical protein PUP91_17055 [Rhizonema sp. PD37]|nr:hypothetical protein [Rhizonema sp. PD37]
MTTSHFDQIEEGLGTLDEKISCHWLRHAHGSHAVKRKVNRLRKVRQDLSGPKQLSLLETPTSESTEGKRRQYYARKGKFDMPGNPLTSVQLSLWDNAELA